MPLAERAPQLGPPLYEAQLAGLVHHVALPQHFTSWEEEGEADEDSFNRLRQAKAGRGGAGLGVGARLVWVGCDGATNQEGHTTACAVRPPNPLRSPGWCCCACREQILPEALETAYGLLRSAYLGFAWHLLQSAGSWQQAEAALYLFT